MDDNFSWKQTNQTYPMQGQWLDLVILVGPFLLSIFYDSMILWTALNSVESFLNLTSEDNFPIEFVPYIVRKEKYSHSSNINRNIQVEKWGYGEESPGPSKMLSTGLTWCMLTFQPAPGWRPGLQLWSDMQDERDVHIQPAGRWIGLIALESLNQEQCILPVIRFPVLLKEEKYLNLPHPSNKPAHPGSVMPAWRLETVWLMQSPPWGLTLAHWELTSTSLQGDVGFTLTFIF